MPNEPLQPDMSKLEPLDGSTSQGILGRETPAAPALPANPPSPNPNLRTTLAPSQQLQPDSLRQFYNNGVPQIRISPLPSTASASVNASAQGIARTAVQQFVVAAPADIDVTDGLTHGDPIWEHDSAYVELRDDFIPSFGNALGATGTSNMGVGELGWSFIGGGAVGIANQSGGAPPYIGQLSWDATGSSNNFASILLNAWNTPSRVQNTVVNMNSFALLENPGWKLTWVFKWDGAASSISGFDATQKSMYVGLSGSAVANFANGGALISPRPDVFIGLRYDTSVTPGALTLTSVANASAGATVYTGTITGGANGAYIGLSFVVAGFTNAANNGIFVCSQSTATTLTLANASGVAETHAATATGPSGIGDSFFTFEAVLNPTYSSGARHNLQGQTKVTTVAPVIGAWHRLDMTCSAAGVVVMTLDGSSTNTFTVTVPTMIITMNSGQASCNTHSGRVSTGGPGTSGGRAQAPFTNGSVVTTALPGIGPLSGTWTLFDGDGTTMRWAAPGVANIGNSSVFPDGTISGYPSLTPMCSFGNDDSAAPVSEQTRFTVDFFSLVWNPNLGPSAPGTPNSTKARYW